MGQVSFKPPQTRAVSGGGGGVAYATAVLADSPMVYWKLDEASGAPQDSSGNSRSLSVGGTLTYNVTGAKSGSKAITFPGTVGNYAGRDSTFFGTRTAFSVECWVKYTGTGDQVFTSLDNVGLAPGNTNRVWSLGITGTVIAFLVLTTTGNYTYVNHSTSGTNDGLWHHVVATYSSGTMVLYVDGAQVDTDTVSGSLSNGGGQWVLVGAGRTGGADGTFGPFGGTLDEVAVYPTALDSTRVAAHYNAT